MDAARDSHSFLFADLVGFTAFGAVHGDRATADLAVRFAATVRALAAEHRAQFVKAMGDSVMVRGTAPDAIARLALRIVAGGAPLPVRIGVHTGPAVGRDGDWYGTTVNVAARVADLAGGGEVLLTAATGDRLDAFTARGLTDHGLRRLRDVPAPVRLFGLTPRPPADPAPSHRVLVAA